ncbi:serine/threonine-protein phosphatase [Chloroflexi bacterium TSY]|nr:serine/threonine-protein phosphatase [Chloroflexi bacterium TSY]
MMERLEVQTAVAKINKYATSESGDTVEVIERPRGGISVVVADGQRSGRSAKAISNIVVRKAISLLAEGVRDGAVARATHDYLHVQRGGKVSAELFIVSVDLVTRILVVSRNSRCPVLLRRGESVMLLDAESEAVGIHHNTKPAITELGLEADTTIVVFTDGVWHAGHRTNQPLDISRLILRIDEAQKASASQVADALLEETLRLDQGRPQDDATVLVLKVLSQQSESGTSDNIRRLFMRFPI